MADVAVIEISNVLGYLIKQASISEAELARKISVPRATINRLVSGRTPDPRASTLNAIAEYFNVSVDQLLGKQPLFLDINQKVAANRCSSIPVIDLKEAKNWKEIIHGLTPDKHHDWIIAEPSMDQGEFGIRLKGESMWPQFQENTILIIDPHRKVKNRDFVLAYIGENDDMVFRQLIIDGRYQFLTAVNSIFPTIQLKESDQLIGVMIQMRKSYG